MIRTDSRTYIAGHSGLIGSACLRVLEKEDFADIVLRRHAELELTDAAAVNDFFNDVKPDYVILAAGKVGGILENQKSPASFIDTNLAIQSNVLRAAQQSGVKALALMGSSCMYPRDCAQPMGEELLLTGHPEPTSLAYAVSKIAGVQLCHAYNKQYGTTRFLPVIPNSAYGPGDNFDPASGHVLSSLMMRMHRAKINGAESVTLWGTGTPRREFIHADDVARAVLHLFRQPEPPTELPFNIGTGTDHSIRELATAIAATVGFKGRIDWDTTKPDGAPRKLLDSRRLRATGWEPLYDLNRGLASTYDWFMTCGPGQGEHAREL